MELQAGALVQQFTDCLKEKVDGCNNDGTYHNVDALKMIAREMGELMGQAKDAIPLYYLMISVHEEMRSLTEEVWKLRHEVRRQE